MKIVYVLLLVVIFATAKSVDKKMDINGSFVQSYIALPKGILGRDRPFFGTLKDSFIKIPNLKNYTKKLPTLLYISSSEDFNSTNILKDFIIKEGFIFFALNSSSTINNFLQNLDNLPFIDRDRIFIMGYSFGAIKVARYNGDAFLGRILLGWGCEPSIYDKYAVLNAKKSEPILNIIGRDDELFGKQNPQNRAYNNQGNCSDALFKFENAKVVILPNRGHDIVRSIFLKDEIVDFIRLFGK